MEGEGATPLRGQARAPSIEKGATVDELGEVLRTVFSLRGVTGCHQG
jgi:hypothetical protein